MATHGFLLLLLVAHSKALWDSNFGMRSWSGGRARAFECTEAGLFCESCMNSVFCSGAGAAPLNIPCDPGQVCGGIAPGPFGCLPYTGLSAGECDCDTIDNSGFLVDPYDPSQYFLCIPPEGQFFLSCPEGEIFSTEENTCISTLPPTPSGGPPDPVDCSTEGVGLHTNDPSCKIYWACYSPTLPGLELTCDADLVFDSSQLRCVPQCELAPPTFECPANSMGALPDTSDCTIFHVCSNGVAVTPSTGVPCPGDEVFESSSMMCVPYTSDVVCPQVNECWAAYCDACGGECPETLSTIEDPSSTITSTSTTTSTTTPTTTPTPTTTTTSTISTTPTTATPTTTTTSTTTTTPTTATTPPTTTTTHTTTTTSTPTTTSTTTASTPTGSIEIRCNNSPGYYEDPSDCKQFYSCQINDAGIYEPVLYRCPGSLVYIPSKSYCSLQSDLDSAPGCIAS